MTLKNLSNSEDGQLWTQTVSSTPATRQDVINLQEMLDTRLQQSQARETGICPIRRELYSQAFGEWLDCGRSVLGTL
jgi:dynein light intermediate chain, axonemal